MLLYTTYHIPHTTQHTLHNKPHTTHLDQITFPILCPRPAPYIDGMFVAPTTLYSLDQHKGLSSTICMLAFLSKWCLGSACIIKAPFDNDRVTFYIGKNIRIGSKLGFIYPFRNASLARCMNYKETYNTLIQSIYCVNSGNVRWLL